MVTVTNTPNSADPPGPSGDPLRTGIITQVQSLRDSFDAGRTRPIADRLEQLAALERAVQREGGTLVKALAADLGKSSLESALTEIGAVTREITLMRRNLRRWLQPERIRMGAMLAPARGRLWREPLGTVLIIAPWNYPLNLALAPLVAAIAGGNTAVLKPSEVAPATSAALASLVRDHLDPDWVRVVEGGVEETTILLEQRFDLIFYTGNSAVGRIVARAAAEHLTPTVLELGGKSPVYVDEGVDLARVAQHIVWGKFTNTGQTCVAPDYLMATAATLERLTPHLERATRAMFGRDPRRSPDYGRIVSPRHARRVLSLIDDDRALVGGAATADPEDRYIPPTILTGVDWEDPVMQEEIFGPVLPLLAVSGPQEAIARIRSGDKPLTAYVFTSRRELEQDFAAQTSSGSLAIGLTLAHLSAPNMPFGGVGESGMGAYHGRAGLHAFTHAKPVVSKPLTPDTLSAVYPPHRGLKRAILSRILR